MLAKMYNLLLKTNALNILSTAGLIVDVTPVKKLQRRPKKYRLKETIKTWIFLELGSFYYA